MVKKSTLNNIIVIFALIMVAIYGINFQPENTNYFKACVYIVWAVDLWLAIKNRKSSMLFFVYIVMLYFNFSAFYDVYITQKPFLISFYNQISNSTVIMGKGIYMMLLFTVILLIFDLCCKKDAVRIKTDFFIKEKNKNLIISWSLLIFASISFMIWWQLLEYSGTLVIIAIYFCGNNKPFKITCTLYIIWLFINLNINGMRIPGLCFPIICIFMLYGEYINYKHILVGMIIAIVSMTYSGIYTDTGGTATVDDAVEKLQDSAGALDTCQFSYAASQISIKVTDDRITQEERLDYFKRFLVSQVVLSSKSVKYCKVALTTKQYYHHCDGSFMPHSWYFYLKWFGVVISGILVGTYLLTIKLLNKNSRPIISILAIWTASMIGKWYLYEPNALLKGTLFLLIVFAGAIIIDKIMKKNMDSIPNREKIGYISG